MGGKEHRDGFQVRFFGVVYVHIGPSVGVDIHKAGGHIQAGRVDYAVPLPGPEGRGDLRDNSLVNPDIHPSAG